MALKESSGGDLLLSLPQTQLDSHSYLLQSVVEFHRPEQKVLLAPQSGADLLAHHSQLDALWPDGVLGVVRVFYQPVPFTGQGQGTVYYVLLKHIGDVRS